jgi:hypothetical protein
MEQMIILIPYPIFTHPFKFELIYNLFKIIMYSYGI